MEEVVKISALCAACTLFVAPLRDFEEVRRRKHVGDRSVFPFVCMWACCALWIMYGLFSGDIVPTVVTNLCGLICSMYYCAVFAWAVESPKRKNQAYNLFAGTFLVVCVICTFCFGSFSPQSNRLPRPGPSPDDRILRHAGLAASAFTVLQYASPLADLLKVLKRQSTEGISRLLASISLICALLWLMYGILTDDAFIYVPNLLGVVFSMAQFALFCMFPKNRRKIEGSIEKEKSLV